jgi:hypothetical protein
MALTKHSRVRRFAKLKPNRKKAIPDQFVFFPKLPFELRDAIWKLCDLPQVITIKNASYEEKKSRYMGEQVFYETFIKAEAKGTVPAILHVNRESRAMGLKFWSLELGEQLEKPIYFNWERDTLFMENWDDVIAFYGGPRFSYRNGSFGNNMKIVEHKLRHLVIGEQFPTDWIAKKIVSRLYNLEELTLPKPPGQ